MIKKIIKHNNISPTRSRTLGETPIEKKPHINMHTFHAVLFAMAVAAVLPTSEARGRSIFRPRRTTIDGSTFSRRLTDQTCTVCEAGKYFLSGSTCSICPAGYYQSFTETCSSIACTACNAGTFNADAGTDVLLHNNINDCLACSAGTTSTKGSSTCTACLHGRFASAAKDTCATCSAGRAASSASASSW